MQSLCFCITAVLIFPFIAGRRGGRPRLRPFGRKRSRPRRRSRSKPKHRSKPDSEAPKKSKQTADKKDAKGDKKKKKAGKGSEGNAGNGKEHGGGEIGGDQSDKPEDEKPETAANGQTRKDVPKKEGEEKAQEMKEMIEQRKHTRFRSDEINSKITMEKLKDEAGNQYFTSGRFGAVFLLPDPAKIKEDVR